MFRSKNGRIKIDGAALALALFIFIPRLLDLDVFLTADEGLFLEHARDFAYALASGDLSQTLGIGYPGVTVASWSAPFVAGARTELAAYVAGRVVTALVTGLLLLTIYRLGRLLLGRGPALVGVGLLALDPYTLAYSRLFHIEAPLALFMTLAALSGLLWLRDSRRHWLFLTGLFTGLALLTKSTALLLWPLLLILILGWRVIAGAWLSSAAVDKAENETGRPHLYQALRFMLFVTLIAAAVFIALWPAMWSQPIQALDLTFRKLLTDQAAGTGNLGLFWLGRFVEDPGPAFYPVAFLLKATPWLLAGLGLSLWFVISGDGRPGQAARRMPPPASRRKQKPAILSLWLFALAYLLVMTVASKKSIRYMLPAFPALYLLAGAGFYQALAGWPVGRLGRFIKPVFRSTQWLLPALMFLLILFTFFYHPYYFTYYNPFVLGWRWAPRTILVGWGEGLDQAARYLNEQPGGLVAAWYEWLFPVFYHGPVEPVVPPENLITADHAVLYLNQVQRDIPGPNIIDYFRTRRRPEYTVRLAGIDYAWVYSGPVAGRRSPPAPAYPLGGNFGDEMRLLGYDLFSGSADQATSGQPLIVTLYWQVLASPPAGRFVYVRLVDDQGHIWARADSPPVMGLWPVDRWQPGMLIEDAQELPLPPGTPPGVYRLEVGLYDPASGQTLAANGQPVGQGGGLLLGQVQVAWQARRAEADLPNRTDVRLGPDARLIGYETPPAAATTGDLLPIRLAWREARPFFSLATVPNNYVMFTWRAVEPETGRRPPEQLDPLPWPIKQWGHGALMLSQHDVVVPPSLTNGRYELMVGLHTGSDPAGELFSLGTIVVSSPPHQFELPPAAARPAEAGRLAHDITLAGYVLNLPALEAGLPPALALNLYWRTSSPITARYKVFAQLLDAGHALVAQSDSFPAGGQRPTTGWLPGEIITDPHTLALPAGLPPGTYRLIAGLYDPITGQRLPVSGAGESSALFPDALFVAKVELP